MAQLEGSLERAVDEKMSSGSAGICVSDNNGLPLHFKGTLKPEVACLATQLMGLAAQLDPVAAQQNPPVVVVTGDHNQVTFSRQDNTIVAVHSTH